MPDFDSLSDQELVDRLNSFAALQRRLFQHHIESSSTATSRTGPARPMKLVRIARAFKIAPASVEQLRLAAARPRG